MGIIVSECVSENNLRSTSKPRNQGTKEGISSIISVLLCSGATLQVAPCLKMELWQISYCGHRYNPMHSAQRIGN